MRRIAVLSACALAGALVVPSSAAMATEDGSGNGQDQWIAVEDHFAIVMPDGETFDEENPPPDEGGDFTLPVGARFFLSEALYATDDGETRGDEIGRTHVECTAQVVEDNLLCVIAFVLDEGSQLHGTVALDFSATPEEEMMTFDIAVTGGTGDFSDATGVVTLTDISDPDDPNGETVTLYEPQLG